MGAEGSVMVWQAFGTLTSRMAFLLTFLKEDFEPRVATSLRVVSQYILALIDLRTHHMVATPCLRSVKTEIRGQHRHR